MSYYLKLRPTRPAGDEYVKVFPSRLSRALWLVGWSAYVDVLAQWEE